MILKDFGGTHGPVPIAARRRALTLKIAVDAFDAGGHFATPGREIGPQAFGIDPKAPLLAPIGNRFDQAGVKRALAQFAGGSSDIDLDEKGRRSSNHSRRRHMLERIMHIEA